MSRLDIDFVRRQFPAFSESDLGTWAHFENAGGSYACGQVIDRLHNYYVGNKLQPYAWSQASIEAGQQMDQARERLAAWFNVAADEVHFGPSTTQNTYVIAQALRQSLKPDDEIIVTNLDHEANVGAFRRLADDGFTVREWSIDSETGELDPSELDTLLSERTRVVAFSHCSNIVGSVNPVRAITDKVRAAGAISVVDGVSYCGHGLPDLESLGADIYLCSLYKVYGPHQGVMVMRREINEQLPRQGHFFNASKPTARFTPAGPDHAQVAASNGVIDYFEALARHHGHDELTLPDRAERVLGLMQDHERALLDPLLQFLSDRRGIRLIGKTQSAGRAPTVSVDTGTLAPSDAASSLAERKIGASAGHFYAWRCLKALGIEPERGVLRLSYVHYTSEQEMDRLIEALDDILPS